MILAGCGGSTAPAPASEPSPTAERPPHLQCPVCGQAADEGAFHYECRSVVSADPDVDCASCGSVEAGTFCPSLICFHFADTRTSDCGNQIGAFCTWCQDFRGWPYVGYCQTCRRPSPKDKPCPGCDAWVDDQDEFDPY